MRHCVSRTIARIASIAMVAGAIAGVSVAGTIATAAPASASGSAAATVTSMTNAARANAGLRPYQQSADLTSVAQSWANQMAAASRISHNPRLRTAIHGWRYVGENVGSGGSLQAIQTSFMKSPTHRSNILDRDFTQMGVGVAVQHNAACDCDIYYVAVDFRQPSRTSVPSASRPAPVSKPAPNAPAKAPVKSQAPAQKHATPAPAKPAPKAAPKVAFTTSAAHSPATAVAPTVAGVPSAGPSASPSAQASAEPSITTYPSTSAATGKHRDPVTRALEFTAS